MTLDLSVVIPLYNEEESLTPLTTWIVKSISALTEINYEIIFVDDGSTDASWQIVKELKGIYPKLIRARRFRRNYGKSAALNQGFQMAQGGVVITMDADLQDSPDEISTLYQMIRSGKYDMVSGWKKQRNDPMGKTVPSKLFNWVARKISGVQLHDFNCGLKAYSKDLVKDIYLYADMHRWIPVLAKWQGYTRITEKEVVHHKRQYGVSKFGAKRLISGFLDLLTIFFVGKFNKRPMHFFGTVGFILVSIGLMTLVYLASIKIFLHETQIQQRPLFFFGIVSFLFGTQLFLTGFLAELVIDSRAKEDHYNISEEL